MDRNELEEILRKHKLWLDGQEGGVRADLRGANLKGANLLGANLEFAKLRGANLRGANLRHANLRDASLWGADLEAANLRGADLESAKLWGADLEDASLRGADLRWAYLENANLRNTDLRDAKLWGTTGDGVYIENIFTFDQYSITYTHDRLQIGCENHSIDEWESFSDERILEMNGKDALEFWKRAKKSILSTIRDNPCKG